MPLRPTEHRQESGRGVPASQGGTRVDTRQNKKDISGNTFAIIIDTSKIGSVFCVFQSPAFGITLTLLCDAVLQSFPGSEGHLDARTLRRDFGVEATFNQITPADVHQRSTLEVAPLSCSVFEYVM